MISKSLFTLLLSMTITAMVVDTSFAAPPVWESDFGDELLELTASDDDEEEVMLSFPFPFEGTTYTTVFVGNNGGIQLGELGDDDAIDYDNSDDSEFGEFYDDGGFPTIFVFETDLDAGTTGTVHFNDFGDRAVFTWNEVGTNSEEEHLVSCQIQIFADGRIFFSYNGILDGPDEDLVDSLGEGILVGISGSTGVDPGPSDFSVPNSTTTDTLYEVWHDDGPPLNTLFDLDMKTLVFVPLSGGGFRSYLFGEEGGSASPDLLIGTKANRLKGDNVRDPRNPSRRQTITHQRGIFMTNTATAYLRLENDGAGDGVFRLKSSGDTFPRMDVTAKLVGGGNISAAVKTGRFKRNIAAGASLRVIYKLNTNRYYAGVDRDGDRHDTIEFKMSGGGKSDTAAMVVKYR